MELLPVGWALLAPPRFRTIRIWWLRDPVIFFSPRRRYALAAVATFMLRDTVRGWALGTARSARRVTMSGPDLSCSGGGLLRRAHDGAATSREA
ncbi:MAG: hypothetical protein WBG57_01510 [Ornithinimicrobium sp.]